MAVSPKLPPADSMESHLGSLRLQIEGSWSVEEFQFLLSTIDDVYKRVATVMTLGNLLREERQRNELLKEQEHFELQDWSFAQLFGGDYYAIDNGRTILRRGPFSDVILAVQPFLTPLTVDAIRVESPGWLQVIGNLNPLKVAADFISKWRSENTKRMDINTKADIERERMREEAARERERMRRAFALEVLKQLPEGQRAHRGARLAEIAEYAITPAVNSLEKVASDCRVIDAELVSAGRSFPPQAPQSAAEPKKRRAD